MENGKKTTLLPIVRWAQKKETLSLTVELQECQQPEISLKPGSIDFRAVGTGAQATCLYGFTLDFFKPIDVESCVHKLTGSNVQIFLTKEGSGEWWPRLTLQKKSPHFLKLDFSRWRSESDDEEKKEQEFDPSFLEELRKQKKDHLEKINMFRSAYLTIYNVMQFFAFAYVFFMCLVNLIRGGTEFLTVAYDRCGGVVQFAVMFSVMEVIHPLAGIMKGSWVAPLMQVAGRNLAFFCLWSVSDYIKHEWYVTTLFMAWSAIELVRYPHYVLQILQIPSKALTWIRYTVWIPLYPLGSFAEVLIYFHTMWVYAEHRMYEISMPNPLNFSIKLTWLLRLYLVAFPYGLYTMMRHMWKMRCRKLGTGKRKMH